MVDKVGESTRVLSERKADESYCNTFLPGDDGLTGPLQGGSTTLDRPGAAQYNVKPYVITLQTITN